MSLKSCIVSLKIFVNSNNNNNELACHIYFENIICFETLRFLKRVSFVFVFLELTNLRTFPNTTSIYFFAVNAIRFQLNQGNCFTFCVAY